MIKEGSAFCEKFINLQNNNTLVKAVDYNDGYLCTGMKVILGWGKNLGVI